MRFLCSGINATPLRATAGFSLVEVLVSGVLVAFSVAAVISVVSTGARLQMTDNDRRQARTLVRATFEQDYDPVSFNTIVDNSTQTDSVTIDEREGIPLRGTMTRIIENTTVTGVNDTVLPALSINVTCRWVDGKQSVDSVTFGKMLPQVNP